VARAYCSGAVVPLRMVGLAQHFNAGLTDRRQTAVLADQRIHRHCRDPAAVGDDAEPFAAQRFGPAKSFNRGEQLVKTVHPQHAGTPEGGIVRGVGTVRLVVATSRPLTRRRLASLNDKNRLVAARAAAGRHKATAGADVLDAEQNCPGHRVVAEEVDDVAEADIGRSAERNEMRKADVAVARPVEDSGAYRRRLRDEGDAAGRCGHLRDAGIEADVWHHQAEAVWPKNAQSIALRLAQHRVEAVAVGCLTIAGSAKHDRGAGAALAERADHLGQREERAADDGKIGSNRQRIHLRISENAGDRPLTIGHRHDRPFEASIQKIAHDDVAKLPILIVGADNGDRAGIKQLVEVVDRHQHSTNAALDLQVANNSH
jgi:hypothetical protein